MKPLLKFGDIPSFLFDLLKQDKGSCLFFFLAGLILRGIPELLIAQYPVGYETITWYAPVITSFQEMSVFDVFAETFRMCPLFYVMMWFGAAVSGAHAFVLLKVTAPFLYGCLIVSFFVFLRRGLRFEWKMAFTASLLLVFQVAALRLAWDRLRNILGLTFVFAALAMLKSNSRLKWPLMAGFAVLTVLSRDYVALILFVTVLGFAFLENKGRLMSLISLAPAFAIFAVMVYPAELWSGYVSTGLYASASYLWTLQDVLSIFAVCYLPLLPFVLKGFRRDHMLAPMVGLLLVGSFSVVVSPRFAVLGYQRWLMLLVFPFSIYAARGFKRSRFLNKNNAKMLKVIVLVFILIGVGYSTGAFSYVGMLPNSYIAVNLVQSSIAWDQVDDVKDVLRWLDESAPTDSSVLAEERFYGWTLIYLKRADSDVEVVPYAAASPPWVALEKVLDDGFRWIYLIWYSDSNLEGFETVYSRNSVSIFQYEQQTALF
ncbi:hypothetical protein KAU93_01275 [Candidatus Bathyarchaeota archaeon]|nr:hypothetical protein [Candidatus Bathyarchaeota archaeon]